MNENSDTLIIPSPREVKDALSLPEKGRYFLAHTNAELHDLLIGKDPRTLYVVGPCSIHNPSSILEYAKQLKELQKEIGESSVIVLRAYIEKSRTLMGWKGYLYDPHLDETNDILAGIKLSRQLLIELINLEIPLAMEIVDPLVFPYISDLISWGFIGARTATSQVHRQFVSNLKIPVGFKNAVDGDTTVALQSILAARASHAYLTCGEDGRLHSCHSRGNPGTHLVLRGSVSEPNYDPFFVKHIIENQEKLGIPHRLLIDCAHGNSQKIPEKQITCFESVLDQIISGTDQILGMMMESHLAWGKQSIGNEPLDPEVSITDPCIDLATTTKLLQLAHQEMKKSSLFATA